MNELHDDRIRYQLHKLARSLHTIASDGNSAEIREVREVLNNGEPVTLLDINDIAFAIIERKLGGRNVR